jgi:predicted tellurium resistance membrane protein TerC
MKETVEKAFTSHVLRYVGVGLISGSIVHMGTLGGSTTRYVVLIALGVIAFIVGTMLEKGKSIVTLNFIIISVLLSIGVGMVSGGTQHYLDGPVYASFLIPFGLLLGYIAFLVQHNKKEFVFKKVVVASMSVALLFSVLYVVAHTVPSLQNHHDEVEEHHH